MDYSFFSALLNNSFAIIFPDGQIALELIECKRLPDHRSPGQREEPFSLMFRGPATPIFPQRIYSLKHEASEPLEIFLVPVGRDATGVFYQAIFN